MKYLIYKNGIIIADGRLSESTVPAKKELKKLGGNVLHIISEDVTDVYKRIGNKIYFSHTNTRGGY